MSHSERTGTGFARVMGMATTLRVSEVMTRSVLACRADWTVDELRRFLVEHGISGAPVVDEAGDLAGMVSATDVLRQGETGEAIDRGRSEALLADSLERPLAAEELRSMHLEVPGDQTVRDLMTPVVFQVEEDALVDEVADLMTRSRIHRVLVVRNARPTGIVSALDLVRVLRDVLRKQPVKRE
jgi:CBS domain-containing protein